MLKLKAKNPKADKSKQVQDEDKMTRNNQSSFARNPTGTYSEQHNSSEKFRLPPGKGAKPGADNPKNNNQFSDISKSPDGKVKAITDTSPDPKNRGKIEVTPLDPKDYSNRNLPPYGDPKFASYGYPYGFLPFLQGHPGHPGYGHPYHNYK